jgi:hypothetical protein
MTGAPMRIVLVSTSDVAAPRRHLLDRMLDSVAQARRELAGHDLTLWLMLQNCDPDRLTEIARQLAPFVRPVAVDRRVPLSTARNQLLHRLDADALTPDMLVAFPDDDCWYPPGFLREVVRLFQREPQLDFWFCRYGSQPTMAPGLASAQARRAPMREIVRNASSNTMFFRGPVVRAVGAFDEALGVGTPLGGAEDLDYALRAAACSRLVACRRQALVGHRDKNVELRAKYYLSGLLVLARHARNGAAAEFLRKIAVGAYLTLRGELAPAGFAAAIRRALAVGLRPRGW